MNQHDPRPEKCIGKICYTSKSKRRKLQTARSNGMTGVKWYRCDYHSEIYGRSVYHFGHPSKHQQAS